MTRTVAILMLVAACGGSVCAGCGADDGEGERIPDAFTATLEPADYECNGGTLEVEWVTVREAASALPIMTPTAVAYGPCAPAVDEGDSWVISCEAAPGFGAVGPRSLRVAKAMDGGGYTRVAPQACGMPTMTVPIATIELIDG